MTIYDGGRAKRSLPFPLQNPEVPEYAENQDGVITNVTPNFFPVDPDERIDVKFNMSFNEFTLFASAIDIGRDIGWGEQSIEVWWAWLRALIGVAGTMACEDVADCVESELVSNTTLQNSITVAINNAGFGDPNHVNAELTKINDRNPSGFTEQEINEQLLCNLDALWGGIRHGIVARMDDIVRDVLEDLAVIPELSARVSAFIDIIPVIGDVAEALVNQVAAVVPTLLNLYNAHSSEATLDEIACDLFSIVCNECRYPTWQELYNYYQSFAMTATPSIGEFVLHVMMQLLSNPVGVLAKSAYFTLQVWALGILYLQALFNGQSGTNAINKFALLGEDFANDNWLQLCESCNEPLRYKIYDFRQESYSAYVNMLTGVGTDPLTRGVWVAGKGWQFTNWTGQNAVRGSFMMPHDVSWKMRTVAVKIVGDGTVTTNSVLLYPTITTSAGAVSLNMLTGTGDWTLCHALFPASQKAGIGIAATSEIAKTMYIEQVLVLYDATDAPQDAIPTTDSDYCD